MPKKGLIYPNANVIIKITFHPSSYGHFEDTLILKYVNEIYDIPIKVMGTSNVMGIQEVKKNLYFF